MEPPPNIRFLQLQLQLGADDSLDSTVIQGYLYLGRLLTSCFISSFFILAALGVPS
ncbi:hypothetical protein [Saccharospirillum impatiens]|uniref:hypothetical protein n=1 Tax=Saccharospirillum impatiens TaxID=169438 RepID=UPI000408E42F|nr:hypothetical protein [Saccharospirillum impatiens]